MEFTFLKGDTTMMPLAFVNSGEKVEIVDFIQKGKSLFCHLRDIGLLNGRTIEVLNNQGNGPMLLKINESKIAIGREMAMRIIVRRLI